MKQIDSTVRAPKETEKNQWNTLVEHPLQSWEWGVFRQASGVETVRHALFQREKLTDAWQLTFHTLPLVPFTIGYFPKGPLPTKDMLAELIHIGKQHQAIYIQLEPNIRINSQLPIVNSQFIRESHHPLFTKYTFILDLTKSEEELLRAMHPKTRYNIKVARKHDVQIMEDNSDDAFGTYLQLTKETTNRQGFYAHTEAYHRRMWQTLNPAGIAHLWKATYQGQILATWVLFYWNDTIYYPYGASSRDNRDVMAPNLLLWEIAQWGKAHGYKKFDLWGAMGPNPDKNDPWYGFHRFKEGFAPELVEFIGSYDLVINPVLYKLYTIADMIRWKVLKRK